MNESTKVTSSSTNYVKSSDQCEVLKVFKVESGWQLDYNYNTCNHCTQYPCGSLYHAGVHHNCTLYTNNTQPCIINHIEEVGLALCLGIIGQCCDECALVQRRWGHRD